MQKEIKLVDQTLGIVQVTTSDERWYCRTEANPTTGLPEKVVWRPSMTFICSFYPKGRGFEFWLKNKGSEADMIRDLAGERGYKVHRAIAELNKGYSVSINDCFDNDYGTPEPLTAEEYACVLSYWEWWETEGFGKYEILATEYTIWPDTQQCEWHYGIPAKYFEWAGTVDLKVRRLSDGKIGIIDMKTSAEIWMSHRMQVTSYKRAEFAEWAGILRLNYKRNKLKKFKFDEIEDCYDVFVATWLIWKTETDGTEPLQRDFPLSLKLRGVEPKEKAQ